MNRRTIGARGETLAAAYLTDAGYTIVSRNYFTQSGEIDIIAEDGAYILFVEVKTRTDGRSTARYGRPAAAVNRQKQSHIVAAASAYLAEHPTEKQPRIDVVEVYVSPAEMRRAREMAEPDFTATKITHLKNAFFAR